MLQRAPNKFLRATSICFVSQERELQRCCWDEGGLHLQQPRTPEARFPRLRQLSSKRPQRPFNPRPGLFKLIRCTCRARRRTGCGQGRLSRQRQGQGTGGHRRAPEGRRRRSRAGAGGDFGVSSLFGLCRRSRSRRTSPPSRCPRCPLPASCRCSPRKSFFILGREEKGAPGTAEVQQPGQGTAAKGREGWWLARGGLPISVL